MKQFETNFSSKSSEIFYCEKCDYSTCRKSQYKRHTFTSKHKNETNETNLKQKSSEKVPTFICNCGISLKSRTSIWRHKKTCNNENNVLEQPKNDILVEYLVKENQEFKNLILEVLKNGSMNNSYNTNNSHNKSFNLQFFLNETCKNAMNITDFVDSLQLQLSDLEKVGEVGYIEGISNIIIKKLNALDVTERPIHCTDKKRETMYIRDEDKWEKEDEKHIKLHKMVKNVAYKNINLISEFREKYPDFKKINSKYSDQFNKIIIESMGGKGDNEYEKEEKIIKRVAKEVFVDKIL